MKRRLDQLEPVFKHIEDQIEDHIARLQAFVRQPSISAENNGIRECALLLGDYFRDLGCDPVEIVETAGHPVVYAERWVGAPRTLAIYLMYDTQPVVGETWSVPPLEGRIVEVAPFGRCLMARGAKNSKGPLRAFLNAIESILAATGTLPVNLILVAEGEEELGSPNLPGFIQGYASRLGRADAMLHPYALQEPDGRVLAWPGTKGLLYVELEANGERWGRGPRAYDIHASQKAIVDSPAWRLVKALDSLVSDDGNTPTIDGFFDDVRPPTGAEEAAVEQLARTFRLDPFKQLWRVTEFLDQASTTALLRRYFFTPTLNIDGIWGGYTAPGSKTVLPWRAQAKLDMRLVPNQRRDDIYAKLRAHLDARGFTDLDLRLNGGGEWSQTPPDAAIVRGAVAGLRQLGVEPEVWPRNVGFFPAYLFNQAPLHLPFVAAGLGHGGRAHSPDEYFVLDGNETVFGLAACEKSYAAMLFHYAAGEGA
ncbi:MAG: M20/M25/M40 family metallo-hydrolase [Chloroflexota bacterium]|nr:M20/M25/M40 family metallo-hydrolase [Chloroflexota bacterium]